MMELLENVHLIFANVINVGRHGMSEVRRTWDAWHVKGTDKAWDVRGKRLPRGNGMLNENDLEGRKCQTIGTGKAWHVKAGTGKG